MDDKQITEILRRAEEMTKGVDANLRPTAFKSVFDMLAGQMTAPATTPHHNAPTRAAQKTPASSAATGGDAFDQLLASINRSEHPDVFNEKRVLERALRVLKIAQGTDCEYLNTQQIAQILTEKFRLPTKYQAVRFALESAPTFTNSKQNGRSTLYAIMHPGEQFLTLPEAERTATQLKRPSKNPANKSKKTDANPQSKGKRHNGTGPKGILMQLIQEGFCDAPKTVGELSEHIKHKKGHSYATNELTTPLVRLVRDEVLNRATNSDNQYVYTAGKA